MEVSGRHARTRAITRDTLSPANRAAAGGRDASRDVASVVSDVSVLCPRAVVGFDNYPSIPRTSVFGDGEALTSDSIVRFRERAEVETSSSSMDTKCTTSATRRTVPTGNSASSRADRSKPSLARIRGDVGGVCPHQFDHGVPATSGVTSGPYRWRKSSMNRPARARSLSAASRPGSPWSG